MSKSFAFTQNSLSKIATKQKYLAIRLFHRKDVDLNHEFTSARWDGSKIVYDGPKATLGQIMDSRKAVNADGKEYNDYYVWEFMNVVDAGSVVDYLIKAPIKGSNNGTVQSDKVTVPQTLGFGGIAK